MTTTTQSNEKAAPHVVLPVDLRDYFAAKAMQAFISRADIAQNMSGFADGYYDEKVAQWAYESADAMLKRRQS